ncbi:MAG TPA: hypothetical protein ACFCUY_08695 [Xenococcaceae cyanobacterium]
MITAKQAVKACILAQFLTRKGLQIVVFQYYPRQRLIIIETQTDRRIRVEINELGKFRYDNR